MYMKYFSKAFKEYIKEHKIPMDAKIYVEFIHKNGDREKYPAVYMYYDLDEWDDHGWALECSGGGFLDIDDLGSSDEDLEPWKDGFDETQLSASLTVKNLLYVCNNQCDLTKDEDRFVVHGPWKNTRTQLLNFRSEVKFRYNEKKNRLIISENQK